MIPSPPPGPRLLGPLLAELRAAPVAGASSGWPTSSAPPPACPR
ncbi:hypothetical protein V2I01_02340 [Micromonospora sp. BRA006-A]|nr:hypothetical protein [Micromonospora sp. BRA006-A]